METLFNYMTENSISESIQEQKRNTNYPITQNKKENWT